MNPNKMPNLKNQKNGILLKKRNLINDSINQKEMKIKAEFIAVVIFNEIVFHQLRKKVNIVLRLAQILVISQLCPKMKL